MVSGSGAARAADAIWFGKAKMNDALAVAGGMKNRKGDEQ